MAQTLAKIDATVSLTRPFWLWLGQWSVVVLGAHQALDRLDDDTAFVLAQLPLPWPDPDTPFLLATWAVVAIELLVAAWAGRTLWRSAQNPAQNRQHIRRELSAHTVLAPIVWGVLGLAGSWVLAMAFEDGLAPTLGPYAMPIAWTVAAIAGWRLAGTGWWAVTFSAPPRRRWFDGLAWAPVLLVVTAYAARFALPVWGWLP